MSKAPSALTRADFVSGQDVRWCPGCGDYAILNVAQRVLPELGLPKEKHVFISGIGCSSRFPYYMNTYGFHTIHGRAPTIASGLKCANPDLHVWVITGDGDGLSIGGNHLIHAIRRNMNLNILLINNRIYGLTKGQYSPTSETGKKTKSSPLGSIDHPVNPLCVALAAEATFVARTFDSDIKHLGATLKAASKHQGTSFIEIYQNCHVFNHKAFEHVTGRSERDDRMIYLQHGKPLIFGKDKNKGIMLDGLTPKVIDIKTDEDKKKLMVHDNSFSSPHYAYFLTQMEYPEFPVPLGVFRDVNRPTYDELVNEQVNEAIKTQGQGDINDLLNSGEKWTVE